MNKYLFKILITGYPRKARDEILNRINEVSTCNTGNIIGIRFAYYTFTFQNGKTKVALQIWDLDEQKRFWLIAPELCYGAMGAVLFFDFEHFESLHHLISWVNLFQRINCDIPIVLCGINCLSYVKTHQTYKNSVIHDFVKNYSLGGYTELRSRNLSDIENLFMILSNLMIKQQFND